MIKKIQKFNRKIYKLLKNEDIQLILLGILSVPAIYGLVYIVLALDYAVNQ